MVCLVGLTGLAQAEPTAKVEPKPKPERPAAEPKVDIAKLTNDPLLGKADQINGIETKGMVAFTFDDGPNPATTPAVIDALEKYNVPATFFIVSQRIVGKRGDKSREVLAREVTAGFQIGSHSYSHPNLKGADAKVLGREVDEAIRILAKETGRNIGLFRAPFGALGTTSRGWLKKRGLTEAFWSVDTLDWQARDSERLRKKVMRMIISQEGGVVLMHDVKPITAKIIASVLDDLEAHNCKRLADKQEPIWPVSIHYFLRDKKQARGVPDDVKKVTEAYRAALPGRCSKRPPPPVEPVKPEKPEKPDKAKGEKPHAKKP
jgi:peptidoglycan/xylan/chitin deacetylase (PgdA/CDA1 family)